MSRATHRAGRLERTHRTEIAVGWGIATKVVMGSVAYSALFARTRPALRERVLVYQKSMRCSGRWHFSIASKPFSGEVAVYERVAPSGGDPQLKVELSSSIFTGVEAARPKHESTILQDR